MTGIEFSWDQPGQAFIPFWRTLICAGRAADGLREDWREQLRGLQKELGFRYIRYHGTLSDDMMIYREEPDGSPVYNWQYLDSLFDFFMEIGIRPFLELSFMPHDLRSGEATVFWWRGNITPPRDYGRWAGLIQALIRHCINRYGQKEVLEWYFEVWNEPNLHEFFWDASQEEYFKLYRVTAETIKKVDPRLRVGGPATSGFDNGKATWVEDFLTYCSRYCLPVDFISTHPYPNCWPVDADGRLLRTFREEDSTPTDLKWVRETVRKSSFPQAEIHLTEWNSSPSPRDLVHDTAFMAPYITKTTCEPWDSWSPLGFGTSPMSSRKTGPATPSFTAGSG